jgi:transketolase C-terminal domain/subunit
MALMRDAFIDQIYREARDNKKIIFITADFGAQSLDRFRDELKDQFIHAGIAEQNMVDFGAGLAISGKQPILYAMAPFLLHRAYEQIKSVVCAMNLPVTFVSVGCGLGYDHATFTHFTPEDVAIAKGLNHMEVWTVSDAALATTLAVNVAHNPKLRYIRLERNFMPDLQSSQDPNIAIKNGYREFSDSKNSIAIVTSGYLTHKALEVQREAPEKNISVFDLIRIKPLSPQLVRRLAEFKKIITLEEQLLEGGIGSGLLEALVDANLLGNIQFKRMGLRDGFDVFNGDRDFLLDAYGLSGQHILNNV